MRKTSHTLLNRMSKWQYALLLLMLLTFTFYSLPTFFGEQPSLGLHGQQSLTTKQQMLLTDNHLTPTKIIEQPERVELVFASQSEQQRAKQLLEQQGLDSAALTLEFHSNAPTWISRLGADPIKLGLDLRGGSQLLIGVDVDFVLDAQTKNLVDTLRTRFREANLRGAGDRLHRNVVVDDILGAKAEHRVDVAGVPVGDEGFDDFLRGHAAVPPEV